MLFKSSREFFFAPVIEFGLLSEWKRLAGKGQEMQDVFWYIKEAIDAYYAGRAFEITIKAGMLRGRVPSDEDSLDTDATTEERSGEDEIDTKRDTDEHYIGSSQDEPLSIDDNVKLDAFIAGSRRPSHLKKD